jgi:cell wall assembly regulator SMI1
MRTVWERIETWLKAQAPEILKDLRPGATEVELRRTENSLGILLPNAVKDSYLIHNGAEGCGLFSCEDFLSLNEMVSKWKVLKDIWDTGFFNKFQGDPTGPVRADWWNPKWIPWLSDASGNHLCFDLDPTEGGTTGQIIRFWHDDSTRQVLATGLDSWLQQFADDLFSGKYIFSDEYGVLSVEDAKELGELKEHQ